MYIESYVPNAFITLEQAGLIIIMEDILEHRIEAVHVIEDSSFKSIYNFTGTAGTCMYTVTSKHTVMFNMHAIRTTPSIYIHCAMYA